MQTAAWTTVYTRHYVELDLAPWLLAVPISLQGLLVYWLFKSEKKKHCEEVAVGDRFSLARNTTCGQTHCVEEQGGGAAVMQHDSISAFQGAFSNQSLEVLGVADNLPDAPCGHHRSQDHGRETEADSEGAKAQEVAASGKATSYSENFDGLSLCSI
eukprot:TRINITY_DN34653_c0_g1_i1.p1 TRINITY_DN34653_c0_g1~~TRINITY_DN34653_c0_g1_i1.p1  ORF type:complete len:157 (-),score=15.22 TRINITY_DN34653_c0_g1_i1:269-739(-)